MLLVLEACSSCRYAASVRCGYQGDAGRFRKVDVSGQLDGVWLPTAMLVTVHCKDR